MASIAVMDRYLKFGDKNICDFFSGFKGYLRLRGLGLIPGDVKKHHSLVTEHSVSFFSD